MKKLAVFVAAIALTLGLAQCKKEQTPTGTGETVFITLNVGDNNNGTRVNVDPNPTSGDQITFENGDQILVASNGKYVGTLTRTDGTFSGEITDPTVGKPLFFYFLGNKIDVNTLTPGTTEECTVNISDQTNYPHLPVISMGRSVDPNDLTQSVNYSSDNDSYTARLYNRCSLMKFNVSLSSNVPEAASTDAICITRMNNKVTVNFANPTDSGFTYDMDGEGLIKMPGGSGEKWAIVLPQNQLDSLFGTVYTDAAVSSCYLGAHPTMSAIEMNKYLDGGVELTITTPKLIGLDTITPNSGNTDYNVQNGQVLTGELHENSSGNFIAPDGSYRICIVDGATVTLSGVTINGDAVSQLIPWAGLTCLGDATIILEGDNTVNAFYYACPGILPGGTGTTLTIKGSGSLSAQSIYYEYNNRPILGGAGIGCGAFDNPNFPDYKNTSCGNIRIEGGTIEATGGYEAAGIGTAGAYKTINNDDVTSTCGDITITGGTIEATGGINAAGIGTGFSTVKGNQFGIGATSTCGNIIISGGSITATGGFKAEGSSHTGYNNAAGIGAGFDGYCPSINIGGNSTGTAIGAGEYSNWCIGGRNNNGYSCPSITIFNQHMIYHDEGTFFSPYSWPSSKH